MKRLLLAAALALLLCSALTSHAGNSISLAWNPSTNLMVMGYNIYYGTNSRQYSKMSSFGNVNNATITNLLVSTTYYFAATAYDLAGLESDYSNEASGTVSKKKDIIHKFNVESAPKVTGPFARDPRFAEVSLTNLYLLNSNGIFRLTITSTNL